MFGNCGTCEQKGKLIDQLMDHECIACVNLKSEIAYLKTIIEKRDEDWRAEREEFKRTVDRLMELAGSRPVGQGVQQPMPAMPSVDEMMGIFDEDTETAKN